MRGAAIACVLLGAEPTLGGPPPVLDLLAEELDPLDPTWRVDLLAGPFRARVALAQGRAYAHDARGGVVALDLASGKVLWSAAESGAPGGVAPWAAGDRVLLLHGPSPEKPRAPALVAVDGAGPRAFPRGAGWRAARRRPRAHRRGGRGGRGAKRSRARRLRRVGKTALARAGRRVVDRARRRRRKPPHPSRPRRGGGDPGAPRSAQRQAALGAPGRGRSRPLRGGRARGGHDL